MAELQAVNSFCNLMETVLDESYGFKPSWTEEQKNSYLELAFVFSVIWGLGGSLSERDGEKFDNMVKKKFQNVDFQADSIINCFINPESI